MSHWQPTEKQKTDYESEGYFILHNVISVDLAAELRGVIRNVIMLPEPGKFVDIDPMNPMEDSPQGRIARYRKLGNFCVQSPLIWHNVFAGEKFLNITRHFLGDDIIVKFNSCFLKPAHTGSATPWHQDNGLWRDGETEPLNFWTPLEPATRENGCMQFIPGSHKTEIVEHVLYPDSIHGELPREAVKEMQQKHGIHHIELDPGDVVFWHSNMWHYSPPNKSARSRIAIAGVWTNPEIARKSRRIWQQARWAMKNGNVCTQFPPEPVQIDVNNTETLKPFPTAKD
ncbi:MAG: phytanoyl-CoA dioxygenase family protein [Candidatus Poribacteria bacterium]|nr:phytanoyl-CoA dioxygenase family protein [Candidatus Poribacteria bacterium]